MYFHFYATVESINAIQKGKTMFVHTKEGKAPGMVHVSFSIKEYDIVKLVDSSTLFEVTKR